MERYMDESLMQRLKSNPTSNPGASRGKLLLLSNFGSLLIVTAACAVLTVMYFGRQIAVGEGSFGNIAFLGLAALVLMGTIATSRVFFIRVAVPSGRTITRSEAPRLFDTLDKLCRKLDGPPIHHVMISREYNVALVSIRARPLFGAYSNCLVIGLPYMLAVPAKEMLSAIARDYGYLCGTHGKLAGRIYRQYSTFAALQEQLRQQSRVGAIEALLYRWFANFMLQFKAHTVSFLRQSALPAEIASIKMFGPQIRANGLIRDALLRRWIKQEFWPKLFKQADSSPRPTFMPYAAMRMAFDASYEHWATREELMEAWVEKPGVEEIYPTLRERVEAIGQPGMLPPRVKVTAAAALLEDAAKQIIEEFDHSWWKEEKKQWDLKFLNSSRAKSRIRNLSDFKSHEQKELASLSAEFDSLEAAKPVLADLLKQPGGPFPKAAYLYGRILLDENDDAGLEHLAIAADNDSTLTEEATHAGYFYLLNKHGEQAAQDWWERFTPAVAEA